MALALAGLGEVAARRGAPRRAGQLLGAGRALLPAADHLLHVIVPYDLSARLTAARADGDPAAFDQGLAEGQAWDIDSAVAAGLANPADQDAGLGSPCASRWPGEGLGERRRCLTFLPHPDWSRWQIR